MEIVKGSINGGLLFIDMLKFEDRKYCEELVETLCYIYKPQESPSLRDREACERSYFHYSRKRLYVGF